MDGLKEMICDPDDFVLRFLLYEFDCLLALHLPNLHRHFHEHDVSWCITFGVPWFKQMLLKYILDKFTIDQMQSSNACVLEIWDAVVQACS